MVVDLQNGELCVVLKSSFFYQSSTESGYWHMLSTASFNIYMDETFLSMTLDLYYVVNGI